MRFLRCVLGAGIFLGAGLILGCSEEAKPMKNQKLGTGEEKNVDMPLKAGRKPMPPDPPGPMPPPEPGKAK